MTVLSFHGRPELKAELLTRIAAHELADTIHAGQYAGRDAQGRLRVCAVGCAMVEADTAEIEEPEDWHAAQEERWGIPVWLGLLEDDIFERLHGDERRSWPRRLVEAIPVGVDLSSLPDRLAVRRLREAVLPLAPTWPEGLREECVTAIEQVIAALGGDEESARSAESAARSAARSAAWSAESARLIEELERLALSSSKETGGCVEAAYEYVVGRWDEDEREPDDRSCELSRAEAFAELPSWIADNAKDSHPYDHVGVLRRRRVGQWERAASEETDG